MKLAKQILEWKDKQDKQDKRVRHGASDEDFAAVVVAKDIPTGRTPTFTLQILTKPEFAPFCRYESVLGPSKGSRQTLVLTSEGVRALLDFLKRSNPQKQNQKNSEEAKRWIEEQLLPQMDAIDSAADDELRKIRVGLPSGRTTVGMPPKPTTVGRPARPTTVGRPSREVGGSITVKIGSTSFSADFHDQEVDTITVGRGKHQRTYTAGQLLEVMENRF